MIISLNIASASHLSDSNITTFRPLIQTSKNVSYNNGNIYLNGFSGPGSIEIYSIIGNKISTFEIQNLNVLKISFPLKSGNMYIIRVVTVKKAETFKIVA